MRLKMVALFLVCCPMALAQNMCHSIQGFQMCTNYNVADPLLTPSDNTANAKTMNVWHQVTTAPTGITNVSSGLDANGNNIHYVIASGGQVWEFRDFFYPDSTAGTWIQHGEMGNDNYQLAVGNNVIWKIAANATGCTSHPGYHQILKWNGSAWVQPGSTNACSNQMSISLTDNTVYERNYDATVSYFNGSGFASVQGGPYAGVSAIDSCTAIMTEPTSHTIAMRYQCNGSAVQTWPTASAPANNMLPLNGGNFLIAASGAIYKLNLSNDTYDLIQGPTNPSFYPPSADSCGDWCSFIATSSGLFWYNDMQLQANLSLNGNTTCSPSCPSAIHTPTLTAKFRKSLTGGQTTVGQGVPATQTLQVFAQDTTWDALDCFDPSDPFTCFSSTSGSSGSVFCSALGSNIFQEGPYQGPPLAWQWKPANARLASQGAFDCGYLGFGVCPNNASNQGGGKGCTINKPFNYYCSGNEQNPDYDGPFQVRYCHTKSTTDTTHPPDNLWGFDTSGKCLYHGDNVAPSVCAWNYVLGFPQHSSPLFTTSVPFGTKTPCTFNEQQD